MIQKTFDVTYKVAKRIVIAVVGTTVLLLGVIMIVAPGPALIVIPIGLAILSIEFAWAKRWLSQLRQTISRHTQRGRRRRADALAASAASKPDHE